MPHNATESEQLFFPFRGTLFHRIKLSLFGKPLDFVWETFCTFEREKEKKYHFSPTPPSAKVQNLYQKRWGRSLPEDKEQFRTAVGALHQEILETLKLFSFPFIESTEQMTKEIAYLQECFSESSIDESLALYHALTKKAEKMQTHLQSKLKQIDAKISEGAPQMSPSQLKSLREVSSVGYETLKRQTEKATEKIQEKLKMRRSKIRDLILQIHSRLEQLRCHVENLELYFVTY